MASRSGLTPPLVYPYSQILVEKGGGRARITLNRPQQRNALTQTMQEELNHALWSADNDTSVHCVVLKGAGADFCSGYDLSASEVDRERADLMKANRIRGGRPNKKELFGPLVRFLL